MLITTALLNTIILLVVSGVHIYWAAGGQWALTGAVPRVAGNVAFKPGPVATLLVALGLAGFAALHLAKLGWLPLPIPAVWVQYGLLGVGGIFFLRVIGDFRYVGFFKRITDTTFAKLDTAYYIPLCLVLSINAFWTAIAV